MSYISKDNLSNELKSTLNEISEIKSELTDLKDNPVTFEDLTIEQIELLRGIRGATGEKGDTGDVNIVHYDSNGETPYKVKIFTGQSIISDGVWSINYSHVGFTKVVGVFANAIQPSTTAGETSTGVTVTSFNNTNATGKSLKGTGVGLLAGFSNLWATDSNIKIQVLAIGY